MSGADWDEELGRMVAKATQVKWSKRFEKFVVVCLVWYAIGDIFWRLVDGHGMLG